MTDVTEAVRAAGAEWFPATAEMSMGGDLHAVRSSPYGLRLLIGDVRGQGAAAGAGARAVLDAFGSVAAEAPTLETVVDALEAAVRGHASTRTDEEGAEDFVTAVVAEIGPDGRALRLVNRGHPAPLLLRPDAVHVLAPAESGPPLGLRDLSPAGAWSLTVPFPPDATLLLLTDGTTEARDADGAFYDPVSRLRGHVGGDPEAVVRTLRREVRAHVARRLDGRPADDMALLALRATHPEPAPAPAPAPR
ncbi:serine/threonine-protein phosphatase [Streptomyces sp. RKND-216]|uniref:PP2C family protein-serine/threonine phosphatase n=1 Tax=Streptomyces sp. RKND-216 TaxID=2562581 RepID=UPI00109D9DB7|nr:PP2C family protein-serine/threonine phosphatase [Streptomyces sp. RKND-216]THA25999.1 serine/threonine-protein phosphatase [Streptomyces sp. RKND-216]